MVLQLQSMPCRTLRDVVQPMQNLEVLGGKPRSYAAAIKGNKHVLCIPAEVGISTSGHVKEHALVVLHLI